MLSFPVFQESQEVLCVDAEHNWAHDCSLRNSSCWGELATLASVHADICSAVLEEVGDPADEAVGDSFVQQLLQEEISVGSVKGGGEFYQDGEGALKPQDFPCSIAIGSGALVFHVVIESIQDVVDEEVDWVQGGPFEAET